MDNEKIEKGIPKKRKKINKKRILVLTTIVLIIAVVVVAGIKSINKDDAIVESGEKYVQMLEDGTKLNNSPKLKEEKQIEGLTFSNIQLTEKDNISVILADVTNNSNEVKGGFALNIKLLNEDGKEITTIIGYIRELQPKTTTQLNTQTTLDFANSYDIVIEKLEQ